MAINPLNTGTITPMLNMQLLMNIQGDRAKFWLNNSLLLQVGVIFLSIYTTLTNSISKEALLIVIFLFSVASPLMRWHADYLKGEFQSILRKFEFYDGLGWKLTQREKSEWLIGLSEKRKKMITASDKMPEHYFCSKKPVSPVRLLENLEESSWWSKHLAKYTALFYGFFTILVICISFAILLIPILGTTVPISGINVADIVVSVISALFSLGFIRLTAEYLVFFLASTKFEETACNILDSGNAISEEEATKLLHEYQATRSSAPMIPTWVWKLNQKRLNNVWHEQRCRF